MSGSRREKRAHGMSGCPLAAQQLIVFMARNVCWNRDNWLWKKFFFFTVWIDMANLAKCDTISYMYLRSKNCHMRHNFVECLAKLLCTFIYIDMKLLRVRHNFIFACEANSATQCHFPVHYRAINEKLKIKIVKVLKFKKDGKIQEIL